MKFFERNEMMRYLTRPATPKTLPQDAGNRRLELTTEERMGFKDAGAVIKPFNNKQREIAKTVYELKDSEILMQRIQSLQALDPYVGKYYSQTWKYL
jgi:hypothetical protein